MERQGRKEAETAENRSEFWQRNEVITSGSSKKKKKIPLGNSVEIEKETAHRKPVRKRW